MTPAHDPISGTAAERLLSALAGVVSAHVVTDAGGRIVEVHILSGPDLHPKQVVRNVESALSAGLGIEIDRRLVSVAQVRTPAAETGHRNGGHAEATAAGSGPAAPATPATPATGTAPAAGAGDSAVAGEAAEPNRLEYVRFEARRDAERCTCEVVLRDGDREFTGSGAAPDTTAGRAEAAARGVLAAIEQARPELRIELEGAAISASRGRSFVIVSAHALLQRVTVPLAGAAPLARSPEEAGILATLQATNRWSG